MSLSEDVQAQFRALVESYKLKVDDGSLSFSEAVALGGEFIAACIRIAEQVTAPGADKKAAVLAAWDLFVEKVVTPIDLPGPDAIIDPIVAKALHWLGNFGIEWLFRQLKVTGQL